MFECFWSSDVIPWRRSRSQPMRGCEGYAIRDTSHSLLHAKFKRACLIYMSTQNYNNNDKTSRTFFRSCHPLHDLKSFPDIYFFRPVMFGIHHHSGTPRRSVCRRTPRSQRKRDYGVYHFLGITREKGIHNRSAKKGTCHRSLKPRKRKRRVSTIVVHTFCFLF